MLLAVELFMTLHSGAKPANFLSRGFGHWTSFMQSRKPKA